MSNCTTVVAQLPPDQDFYVRDWTNNPGSHDNGEEPSTNYTTNWAWTSDVWNRGVNNPGSPNASDRYPTDNMFAGLGMLRGGIIGASSAFTATLPDRPPRLRRSSWYRNSARGSNFLPVGLPTTLSFGTSDLDLTQGSYWQRGPTSLTHACMAVQISTPADPYLSPGLSGHSPGDPDGSLSSPWTTTKRNAIWGSASTWRTSPASTLRSCTTPRSSGGTWSCATSSPAADQMAGAQIEVVGGRAVDFRSGGTLMLAGMQPGENRWIGLKFIVPTGDPRPCPLL